MVMTHFASVCAGKVGANVRDRQQTVASVFQLCSRRKERGPFLRALAGVPHISDESR